LKWKGALRNKNGNREIEERKRLVKETLGGFSHPPTNLGPYFKSLFEAYVYALPT